MNLWGFLFDIMYSFKTRCDHSFIAVAEFSIPNELTSLAWTANPIVSLNYNYNTCLSSAISTSVVLNQGV